jgi:hypothetical protein
MLSQLAAKDFKQHILATAFMLVAHYGRLLLCPVFFLMLAVICVFVCSVGKFDHKLLIFQI